MKKPIWTWLPESNVPTLAGHLEVEGDAGRFTYHQSYMDTPLARTLDPLNLRFSRKLHGQAILENDGFPGVTLDAMPAGYGADRLKNKANRDLSQFDLLELGPPDGVGAIEVCDDIDRKLQWRPHSLGQLLTKLKDLEEDAPSSRAIRSLDDDDSTSAGGERPKITIVDDGKLWLAKLQDRGDTPHLPAREYAVMNIAKALGLNVPEIRFIQYEHREIFLIERFDRYGDPNQPGRHLFASAHTLLKLSKGSTRGDLRRSYLVFADQIRKWSGKGDDLHEDLQELWKRMVFNALVGNHDDHVRNHGLIHDGSSWRLSKAFDITPLPQFSGALAMSVSADGGVACTLENFLRSAAHFEMSLSESITWIKYASQKVSEDWRQQLQQAGVSAAYLKQIEPAFTLAEKWGSKPFLVDEAADL